MEEGSGWAKQEAEIKKQKFEGQPQAKQMCRASLLYPPPPTPHPHPHPRLPLQGWANKGFV